MKRSPRTRRRRMTTLLASATAVAGVGAVALLLPGFAAPAPAVAPTAATAPAAAATGTAPVADAAADAAAPAPQVAPQMVIAAPKLVADAPSSGCADVEAIGIRGTTEPQGGGIVAGPLASALQDQLDQTVKTFNLVYPASFDYERSKAEGVTALRAELSKTSAACPETQFVIIGYSQGADVIGDTLQSGNVPAADQIGAVAMFGDPAFNSREPFVTGSFRKGTNGVFPRRTGALDEFSDRIVSFCNVDDTFCQRGATGTGHFRYGLDRQKAVDAVAGKLG
jgi:Cutinase